MLKSYLLTFLILGWSLRSDSIELAQFELSNGDSVTCTPILEQPSLSSVNLKDAKFPNGPFTTLPAPLSTSVEINSQGSHPEIKRAEQLFTTEAGACPEGTIPIARHRGSVTRKVHVSPDQKNRFYHRVHYNDTQLPSVTSGHEYGTAYNGGISSRYGGGGAQFNLWKPSTEVSGEFSLSQIWITAGSYNGNTLNTIEVGWQVYRDLYGDDLPHLFVYWTRDAYVSTGCYNLHCTGFVQYSNQIMVGGSWNTVSQMNGNQYEIQMLVYKDSSRADGDWWLQINGVAVGYWPSSLFTLLTTGADSVNWGGEIVNVQSSRINRHTRTQMGSGQFSGQGWQKAAYIRNMQTVDLQNTLHNAPLALNNGPLITNPECYDAAKGTVFTNWGTYIFFGGPGYSNSCPI